MKITLRIPMFNTPLWLFVGEEEKDRFARACKKHLGMAVEAPGYDGKQCGSILWIAKPDLGVLVHELVHYADEFTLHHGIEDKNREVEAYVVGWAVDKLWPKINKETDHGPLASQ